MVLGAGLPVITLQPCLHENVSAEWCGYPLAVCDSLNNLKGQFSSSISPASFQVLPLQMAQVEGSPYILSLIFSQVLWLFLGSVYLSQVGHLWPPCEILPSKASCQSVYWSD